jgi:excisionase family DNA binding protein
MVDSELSGPYTQRRSDVETKPILVTVDELAAMLSIGRTAAWELVRKRKINSVKIGRTRRVPVSAIQEYVEQLLDDVRQERIRGAISSPGPC